MGKLLREKNIRKSNLQQLEVWRFLKGFEGYYEVSNHGRVRRCDRCLDYQLPGQKHLSTLMLNTAILTQYTQRLPRAKPFLFVKVHDVDGKEIRVSVHRAVAQVFVPNPENKRFVAHLNDDYTNNCADNLIWCSGKEFYENRKRCR